jgi:hypothetical protein
MTTISQETGRWELINPNRHIIAYRHPENFDDTCRWHLVDPTDDRTARPYRDDDTINIGDDIIETLIICRCGSTGDAGVQLSAIASLAAELDSRLPETIFEARNQAYTWAEIPVRLDMPESTLRHRYSSYVTLRKEMPPDRLD